MRRLLNLILGAAAVGGAVVGVWIVGWLVFGLTGWATLPDGTWPAYFLMGVLVILAVTLFVDVGDHLASKG